jgi:hypothetical protein
MWRHPILNLCFVIVVITVLNLRHSVSVFGPTAHGWIETDRDAAQGYAYMSDGERPMDLRSAASLSRATSFLQDTWHRGMVIKEWLMEYNTAQWEIFSSSSPAETDLLEARFHVANAEVFTEAMSENERAIKELIRAETSLQAVQTLVKPNLAPQLTTIRDEVTAAEGLERTKATFTRAPFETIKTDLDHLIERVRVSKT